MSWAMLVAILAVASADADVISSRTFLRSSSGKNDTDTKATPEIEADSVRDTPSFAPTFHSSASYNGYMTAQSQIVNARSSHYDDL